MNKICTTIEQSKKLIELGIDIITADMYWWATSKKYYIEAMDDGDFNEREGHVPAWSLSALLDVLPVLKRIGYEKAKPNIYFNVFTNKWVCNSLYYTSSSYDKPLDAAFEMVCWLKENGKI